MRKAIIGAFIVLVALGALSCDEAKKMYVEGSVQLGTGTDVTFAGGTLAKGGGDYYGYCSYSGEEFDFQVGTSAMSGVNSTNEVYIEVTGVQGPPIDGVYDDPAAAELEPKDDQEIAFGYLTTKSGGNIFSFRQSDVDTSNCFFSMFAEAAQGELTINGRKKFDYYVHVNCTGLTDVLSGDTSLNSLDAEFYFKNCD
jgi:hypothetical protein